MSNMVVQTNVLALNSHRYMKQVGQAQSKSSARLSSGYKINSAADDAAGLAISEKMRAQIRGLDQASKNAQDGISLIQTAEGGMQEIDNMLQRIRELVVSVSNDTNENNTLGTGDRQKMQDEIDQLVAEIDSMSERVEFNKKKVINGSYADTALQLRNATAEYDRSSLAKVETNAKLSAYKDALGVSDDTSNATGTTAYSRLNATQDAVDAGVAPYTAALKAYTAAGVTYKEAQNAYNTTRQTMDDQLSKVNLVAADITNAMLNKTDTTYLGDEFARAFTAYQEASNTWGIEGLGFVTDDGTSAITVANALTGEKFTGISSVDNIDLTSVRAAQQAFDTALTDAAGSAAAAAYLDADPNAALKTAYETAKTALAANATYAANLGSLTGAVIESDKEMAAAIKAYAEAANAYGFDELGLGSEAYNTEIGLSPAITALTVDTTPDGLSTVVTSLSAQTDAQLEKVLAYIDVNNAGSKDLKGAYDTAKNKLEALLTTAAGAATTISALGTLTCLDAYATDATKAKEVVDALSAFALAANNWGAAGHADATAANLTAVLGSVNSAAGTSLALTTNLGASSGLVNSGAAATSAAKLYDNISATPATANLDIAAVNGKGYEAVKTAYESYKSANTLLDAALTTAGLASVATLTNENVMTNPALKTALETYATAAQAWGVDAKDILSVASAGLIKTEVTIADNYKVDTNLDDTTPIGVAAQYESLTTDQQALIDAVVTAKTDLNKFGEYEKYQVAKEKFATVEAEYNDLVAKRDTAQATVNTLTNSVESTEKEKTRTDMLYNVANAKLDTAKNAVEADDSQALYFQVGANAMQGLEMSIGSVKSDVLGIGDGKGVTNIDVVKDTGLDTTALLDVLDTALSYVTTERSRLGAAQNRLEYTIKSLDISSENLSAAESRIRDTDMAKEMMELTKANTLQQASISMLAQANQAPQSVLQLLG